MNLQALKNPLVILPFTFLMSLVLHFHIFKMDLVGYHVWRQTQTQITIENFYKEDFNILNPRLDNRGNGEGIQRWEFPLMQWLIACFYKLFGDHLVITRILSFVVGLFSVTGIYVLAKNLFQSNGTGIIAAWAFNFSPVFYYYTMNPLPDNLALCSGIWGLALFIKWVNEPLMGRLVISSGLFAISAMCKLPFILYSSFPLAYLFLNRKRLVAFPFSLVVIFSCILPAAIWYFFALPEMRGNPVLEGIFSGEKIGIYGLFDILLFNLVSTLPELLVNYGSLLFFLSGIYFVFRKMPFGNGMFVPLILFLIVLIFYFFFEMKQIAKVHDYYLFPFLPLIFITVAYGCRNLLEIERSWIRIFSVFALSVLPITAFLRADTRWDVASPGFNPDWLKYKDELRSAAPSHSLCILGNDESKNIFFYYAKKKGWSFDHDQLSADDFKKHIAEGAKVLYSDSRIIDENEAIKPMLGPLLMQKGSVKVFSLEK